MDHGMRRSEGIALSLFIAFLGCFLDVAGDFVEL